MAARVPPFQLRIGFLWLRVALSALTAILPLVSVSGATTLQDTGQWSNSGSNWGDLYGAYAIHMALTRGEGTPYHSHVIWWDGSRNRFDGRELAWRPFTSDCTNWPDSNFIPISVSWPGINFFCSGHNSLDDGRELICGGNDSVNSIAGERGARVWQPGTAQGPSNWVDATEMREHRWYPTTTALADGRVLVLNGYQNEHHAIFGGRVDSLVPSQDVADSVRLYEPVPHGQWFQSVIPDSATGTPPNKPVWRELHSAACMELWRYGQFYRHQVYFGGKDASGHALGDTWLLKREDNLTGADFHYKWEKGPPPSASVRERSEHTAVGARSPDESMYVFGGLADDSLALGDLRQLYWNATTSPAGWDWRTPSKTGTAPTARYGHTAFYDEIPGPGGTTIRRMILFGGTSATNAAPTDSNIYEMRIAGPSSVAWSVMVKRQLGWGSPSPRFGHAMDVDLVRTENMTVNDTVFATHVAALFGGQTGTNTYSDEFWFLRIFNDGSVGWEKKSFSGSGPSARRHATLVYDPLQGREEGATSEGRAYVFGGENGSGPIDKDQYAVDPFSAAPAWYKWAAAGATATGHTTVLQQEVWSPTARVAEIYDPVGNSWTAHTSTNLYQNGYGPTFLTPGHATGSGRVFSMAVDDSAYHVDVGGASSGTWTPYSHGGLGFKCAQMVMYRPGKILAASGFDRGTCDTCWVGRTMKFDTQGPDSLWKQAAYGSGAGSLTPRLYHNLVLLPNGKVMAIGGVRCQVDYAPALSTKRPQIWDPDAASGMGAWSDSSQLAIQGHGKNYHSTAILLPDGRVLSAGGATPYPDEDEDYGDLYSPPYLFNGDALATRPTLIASTGRWRYNQDVTLAVSGDTTIRNVCLIRAPSTTHGFDQSQRYVPLTLLSSSVRGDGVRQYFLKAPPDSFTAPPGDYLLFASDASGVPSIAKWVRVGSVYSGQFDATAPDTLIFGAEFVTCDKIYLNWIAPGDDGQTGTALDYDVRYDTLAVTTSTFSSNSRLGGLPIPYLSATVQKGDSLVGLRYCTWYYFGGKTRDRAENWSALGRARIKTACSGLCFTDPGESMRRSRDETSSTKGSSDVSTGLARVRAFVTPATLTSESALRLVAEYVKGESVHWTLAYRDVSSDAPLREATATQLAVQEPSSGGWTTRSILSVSPGPLGVRSLLRTGRVVFPAGTSLQSIEPAPQSFLCSEAAHSTLGDLLATSSALDSVSIEAATGDSLTLAFTADTSSTAGEDLFFKVLVPGAVEQSRVHSLPRVPIGPDLPTEFALHSAHPNPFSHATSLRFDLPRASDVRIEIFDVQGRRIATLTNGRLDAGRHVAEWDGSTERGGHAAAGVYLCRMKAGEFTAQKSVSLLP